jgi:hypothetical protein
VRPSREPIEKQREIPSIDLADAFEQLIPGALRDIVVAGSIMEGILGRCEGEPHETEVVSLGKLLQDWGTDEAFTIAIATGREDESGTGLRSWLQVEESSLHHPIVRIQMNFLHSPSDEGWQKR